MDNILEFINIKYKNNNLYNRLIKDILNNNKVYLSTMGNYNQPTIIPIKGSELIAIQVFETLDLAKEYKKYNKIDFVEISVNNLLLMLNELFFKGVTGVLYFNNSENKTTYLLIEDIIKDNPLINKDTKNIISILNDVLINKNHFNYLYHFTLSADEILYCIVRFNVNAEGSKKYINLFTDECVAETYCYKKGIYGEDKDKYPITTIVNDVLYHSLVKVKDKIDFVIVHTKEKKYRVDIDVFIQLIINVGFNTLLLD